ncbi:ROK family transcriptional regulator [Moorella sp. Hama-1]|uniref:ROK family transcriptional regulator n=1 Tax=Moorella sp. Hama-1 TaxID=2138101 RepID=UPI000D64E602|nr:ROK family transcriptional regulator [Moorella sp. Hama-1]BCV20644.1 xylose repressor [Moorella sp. Hama-1]
MKTSRGPADLKLLQEMNRAKVLETIRASGPIARVDIARQTHLSPTTVASLVSDLIADGWVRSVGEGRSRGGRKPTLLEFNARAGYIVAVDVTDSYLTTALTDLNAQELEQERTIPHQLAGDALAERIGAEVGRVLSTGGARELPVVGIGISTPGLVDAGAGVIRYSLKLNWMDLPLGPALAQRFHNPVYVENDTNAAAIGEKWFGAGRPFANMVYVSIGSGVGAGLILNGEVFRGFTGSAGELGHMSIDKGGERCECGNIGCLENLVAWPAIWARVTKAVKRGVPTVITEIVENIDQVTPEILNKAALAGDQLAVNALAEAGVSLGIGLANLINLLNPEAIILGGSLLGEKSFMLQHVRKTMATHGLKVPGAAVRLIPNQLGEKARLFGVASIVLHNLLATKFWPSFAEEIAEPSLAGENQRAGGVAPDSTPPPANYENGG